MNFQFAKPMSQWREYVMMTLIYWVGINVYYVLWYLGSEGNAWEWGQPGLSFISHWWAGNGACGLTALIVIRLIHDPDEPGGWQLMVRKAPIVFTVSLLAFTVIFSLLISSQALYHGNVAVLGFLSSKAFLSLVFYHLLLSGLMMLLYLTTLKSGGVRRWLLQLFSRSSASRVEEKGFAFIDMNSSTAIAEKLGHQAYSQLINVCFDELDGVLHEFPDFEVYQYVGDEAIITWDVKLSSAEAALLIFQQFTDRLTLRAHWFELEFGVVPHFKCAIHKGEVMKSQLGAKNPQTAYHGDVLNMTSRMLDLCHRYQTSLILSHEYKVLLGNDTMPALEPVEHEFVNGHRRKMRLYKAFV